MYMVNASILKKKKRKPLTWRVQQWTAVAPVPGHSQKVLSSLRYFKVPLWSLVSTNMWEKSDGKQIHMRRNMTLVHKPLLRFCFSLPVRAEKDKKCPEWNHLCDFLGRTNSYFHTVKLRWFTNHWRKVNDETYQSVDDCFSVIFTLTIKGIQTKQGLPKACAWLHSCAYICMSLQRLLLLLRSIVVQWFALQHHLDLFGVQSFIC